MPEREVMCRLPFDKVYVISLPDSRDRRSHIARHLPEAGLSSFEFHDAIGPDTEAVRRAFAEGQVKSFPPCFRCGKVECGEEDCNNVLTPQQVATYLTYREVWRKIESNSGCALVCEDDVLLHPWWMEVMEMIVRERDKGGLPLRSDKPSLIRLGWAENAEHGRNQPFRLSREVRMSNPCHLVTPAYARMLLAESDRIEHTVDVFAHRDSLAARNFAWTAHPPAATELSWSRGAVASLIHPKPVHSAYLRRMGRHTEAAEHDARIANHVKHLFHRCFLIVGHPGCGVDFTGRLLGQMGFDIGLEADGRDGLASWMFAVDGPVPYARDPVARRREALRWRTLVMPIRNIATAVPSIMRDNIFAPPSYEFRRRHIAATGGLDLNMLPDNFQRAVASFLHWNRLIEDMSPDLVFRVESDHSSLLALASKHTDKALPELNQLDLTPTNANKQRRWHRHRIPRVSAQDWASLPPELWSAVAAWCEKHGYDLPKRASSYKRVPSMPDVPLATLARQFCGPSGWSRSMAENRPVTADGQPLPWFTFGAIEFLQRLVRPEDRVFEYGAGHSTLWWQQRARCLTSVEHDAEWVEQIRPSLRSNARIVHVERFSNYPDTHGVIIEEYRQRMRRISWPDYEQEKVVRRGLADNGFEGYAAVIMDHADPFDIIVVDGMARRLCCAFAIRKLAPDGVIILDNSNRRDYDAAFDILEEAGFRQIPFWGLVPGANFMTCTSVFIQSLSRVPSASHCPNSHDLPEY